MQNPVKPLPIHLNFATLSNMEKRIIQLESLSALQDKTIAGLNEEIFRQQRDLQKLQQRLEQLENKLEEQRQPQEFGGNERPPHY